MLDYIDKLDAEKDMRLLRSTLALDEDCLLTLFTGTTLIQTAARKGLTLHQTGMLMVREASDRPSALEQVVADAVCFFGLLAAALLFLPPSSSLSKSKSEPYTP